MGERSTGLYGARKVWWQLRLDGIAAARCTVERLMREAGHEGVRRGRRSRTTIPDERASQATDLVGRDFSADAPNRLWVADFSYVMTWSGAVYVALLIDAFSRRIVAWKADTTMKTSLVLDTLEMALWTCQRQGIPLGEGMICHNDAGTPRGRTSSARPRRPPNGWRRCLEVAVARIDGEWLASTTILTTAANGICRPVHDRMPCVLDGRDAEAQWLAADVDVAAALELLVPLSDTRCSATPANPAVNRAGIEGSELLAAPSGDDDLDQLSLV